MPVQMKIDDSDDDARERRLEQWRQYQEQLDRADDQSERMDVNKAQQGALRQATEMDAQPQQQPAGNAVADAVVSKPAAQSWVSGIKRVGATHAANRPRELRHSDPASERQAASVHCSLGGLFGDKGEQMQRGDAEILSFAQSKNAAGNAAVSERVQGLIAARGEILSDAEATAKGDRDQEAKLSAYRQWSSNFVGRAETKLRAAL
jgi:hypothetical protein